MKNGGIASSVERTDRDSSENIAASADHNLTIKPKRSRSAWFMPKPKPFGPILPFCMDNAYWDGLKTDGDVVYFLGASKFHGDGTIEIVKIGHSRNLGNRLNQLCGNMGMMRGTLLATAPGGADRERSYHKHFAEHRQSGEWFRPDPSIMAEVARLSKKTKTAPDHRQVTEGLTATNAGGSHGLR